MLANWREAVIVILGVTCFYLYIRPQPECPVIAQQHHDESTQKVDTIQHVVTIVTEPDGTKTEKTITTEKVTKVSDKSADKAIVVPPPSDLGVGHMTRYDLHVSRPISFSPSSKYDYQIGVGARIGNLPLFGTVDYRWQTRELLMGVRVEW